MTSFMKTCSFLHATFTETMEVVENLFKKAYGEQFIMLQVHIGIAFLKHFQCVSAINVTENKETIWKFTLTKYHV